MKPDILYYVLRWLSGFCDIIDGICCILTCGFYNPYLSFKLTIYSSKRNVKNTLKRVCNMETTHYYIEDYRGYTICQDKENGNFIAIDNSPSANIISNEGTLKMVKTDIDNKIGRNMSGRE